MGQFHQLEQTQEQFADEMSGNRVSNVEFGDNNPTEIAIHLNNGETLFVGAENYEDDDTLEQRVRLCFTKQVFS